MASDHFSFLLFVQPPSCSSRCQFQRRGIIHFRGISHGIRPLLLSSFCSATFMFFEVPVPKKGNHPFPGHQPWHPTTSPFFFLFSHLHVLRGASSKEGVLKKGVPQGHWNFGLRHLASATELANLAVQML